MMFTLSQIAAVFEGMLRCPERVAYDGNCNLDLYEGQWCIRIFMDCGEPDYVDHIMFGDETLDFMSPLAAALTNYLAVPAVWEQVLRLARDCQNWDYA